MKSREGRSKINVVIETCVKVSIQWFVVEINITEFVT